MSLSAGQASLDEGCISRSPLMPQPLLITGVYPSSHWEEAGVRSGWWVLVLLNGDIVPGSNFFLLSVAA